MVFLPIKKLSDLQPRAKMGIWNHLVLGACFLLLLLPRSFSRLEVPYIFAVKFIKQVPTLPPTNMASVGKSDLLITETWDVSYVSVIIVTALGPMIYYD